MRLANFSLSLILYDFLYLWRICLKKNLEHVTCVWFCVLGTIRLFLNSPNNLEDLILPLSQPVSYNLMNMIWVSSTLLIPLFLLLSSQAFWPVLLIDDISAVIGRKRKKMRSDTDTLSVSFILIGNILLEFSLFQNKLKGIFPS